MNMEIKMYLPRCEYNMVGVVDSSLLTQNPQFVFFSPRWYGTFPPAILAPLIVVALVVVALIAAAVVFVVVVVSIFALVCVCKTYRFIFNQSHPVPFSVRLSTTFNTGGTSGGSDSICFQGYVMDRIFVIQRSFLSQNRCFQ